MSGDRAYALGKGTASVRRRWVTLTAMPPQVGLYHPAPLDASVALPSSWLRGTCPEGVQRRTLTANLDDRGSFTEIFRAEWGLQVQPVQWNLVHSRGLVLRGVHVHLRHTDYFLLASGHASVGLHDLRPGSPTEGQSSVVHMTADEPAGIVIPPGVAHGFFFHVPSIHVYAVSQYWDKADELGCHWADPDLQIPWPMPGGRLAEVQLSEYDAALPSLKELAGVIPAWRPPSTEL